VFSARRVLYPERRLLAPPQPRSSYTTHRLFAADGSAFEVWRVPAAVPRARLMLVHGYYANRDQVLGIAAGLAPRGYESLLFELRGHGTRPGPCTLGWRETEDVGVVLGWLRTRERAGLPVGVVGLSMGGVVACQAAGRYPQIRAVVLDSVYARFFPVLRRSIRRQYHLPAPWAWLTGLGASIALRMPLNRMDPLRVAATLRQPLLFIQGGEDRHAAAADAEALFERWAGPKERWLEPHAAHAGVFTLDPQQYSERVAAFLERALGG
jgi:alpha-beta hydrolase superfamily lysophospholipase